MRVTIVLVALLLAGAAYGQAYEEADRRYLLKTSIAVLRQTQGRLCRAPRRLAASRIAARGMALPTRSAMGLLGWGGRDRVRQTEFFDNAN